MLQQSWTVCSSARSCIAWVARRKVLRDNRCLCPWVLWHSVVADPVLRTTAAATAAAVQHEGPIKRGGSRPEMRGYCTHDWFPLHACPQGLRQQLHTIRLPCLCCSGQPNRPPSAPADAFEAGQLKQACCRHHTYLLCSEAGAILETQCLQDCGIVQLPYRLIRPALHCCDCCSFTLVVQLNQDLGQKKPAALMFVPQVAVLVLV